MSELYIYLGRIDAAHLFMHVVQDEKYDLMTGAQVYQCMIHNTMIHDKRQVVLIYDFYKDKIDVLATEHGEHRLKFDKEDLELALETLLRAKRDDNGMVIEYTKGEFRLYEKISIKEKIPSEIPKIKINEIHQGLTLKPIPYLD